MAGNIGVKLNLAVGKINGMLPNFIPPTLILLAASKRLGT